MSIRSEITTPLNRAFSSSQIQTVGEKVGALAFNRMRERTQSGAFIGGQLQNKGYSTRPISAYKLGKVTYLKGGGVSIKRETSAPVRFKKDELKNGLILGGYKKFREKAGRKVDKVDLTFTGAMLNSFRYILKNKGKAISIVFGVAPSQERKAFWNNLKREWLGLSSNEVDSVGSFVEKEMEQVFREIGL